MHALNTRWAGPINTRESCTSSKSAICHDGISGVQNGEGDRE